MWRSEIIKIQGYIYSKAFRAGSDESMLIYINFYAINSCTLNKNFVDFNKKTTIELFALISC